MEFISGPFKECDSNLHHVQIKKSFSSLRYIIIYMLVRAAYHPLDQTFFELIVIEKL